MTQSLSFTLPEMSLVGPSTNLKRFDTKRTGADRYSANVMIKALHYDESAKAIRVFCSDGMTRTCLVNRLASIEDGRTLWKALKEAGQNNEEVCFIAAGGFSPDRWFYDIVSA
jgi:hypothetical protein